MYNDGNKYALPGTVCKTLHFQLLVLILCNNALLLLYTWQGLMHQEIIDAEPDNEV
jgi:hypothetical protein